MKALWDGLKKRVDVAIPNLYGVEHLEQELNTGFGYFENVLNYAKPIGL